MGGGSRPTSGTSSALPPHTDGSHPERRRPSYDGLLVDLTELRAAGIEALRNLDVPALDHAVGFTDPASGDVRAAVRTLLRTAIARLGSGQLATGALNLLGLDPERRGLTPTELRAYVAENVYGRGVGHFRQRIEPKILGQVAEAILELVEEAAMRDARDRMERRLPAESRLAVQWVDRFEAYYRIWTPVHALGNDLTAYRSTLLETDRPYDRQPDPDDPDDLGYTQETQAQGYATFALYRYACYQWELRQFVSRHGGMWLLSDGAIEQAVADAVYRIGWRITPFNERDDSWLRGAVDDARQQEMHHFLNLVARTSIGKATHEEWQEWCASCECSWAPPQGPEEELPEYFPTWRYHEGIRENCQVHQVIEACGTYCDLIDRDWRKIADWYHDGEEPRRGVSAEWLYRGWRDEWPRE